MEKGKARFDVIWIHTRHIKNVTKMEVERMLDLTADLAKGSVEEISVRMSGWEFVNEPISYESFLRIFEEFAEKMAIVAKFCPLRVLKLDFSSWYVNNLEAYNFLARTVDQERMFASFEKGHENRNQKAKDVLKKYLANLDKNY